MLLRERLRVFDFAFCVVMDAPSLQRKRFRVRPLDCKMDFTHIAIAAPSPLAIPPNFGATAFIQRQKCCASFGLVRLLVVAVRDLLGII